MAKDRMILILEYLHSHSDIDHAVSSVEIRQMLAENGFPTIDQRTVNKEINKLVASGYEISVSSVNGKLIEYRLMDHQFEPIELKILIDAVSASQFISTDRSLNLIRKLSSLASENAQAALEPTVISANELKKIRAGTICVADDINTAILQGKKISYQMIDYQVPTKERVPHRKGHTYVVSPYDLIWVIDRYYMIGYEDERSIIITPRVDHIMSVTITDEPIVPKPAEYNLGDYYTSVYKMFSGPEYDMVLECPNRLLSKMIDYFGMDFPCEKTGETHFRATVHACVGNTFFGWLTQYAGSIRIVAPAEVRELYLNHLAKAISTNEVHDVE